MLHCIVEQGAGIGVGLLTCDGVGEFGLDGFEQSLGLRFHGSMNPDGDLRS